MAQCHDQTQTSLARIFFLEGVWGFLAGCLEEEICNRQLTFRSLSLQRIPLGTAEGTGRPISHHKLTFY